VITHQYLPTSKACKYMFKQKLHSRGGRAIFYQVFFCLTSQVLYQSDNVSHTRLSLRFDMSYKVNRPLSKGCSVICGFKGILSLPDGLLVLWNSYIDISDLCTYFSGYNHPPNIFLCFDIGAFILNHKILSYIDCGIHALT